MSEEHEKPPPLRMRPGGRLGRSIERRRGRGPESTWVVIGLTVAGVVATVGWLGVFFLSARQDRPPAPRESAPSPTWDGAPFELEALLDGMPSEEEAPGEGLAGPATRDEAMALVADLRRLARELERRALRAERGREDGAYGTRTRLLQAWDLWRSDFEVRVRVLATEYGYALDDPAAVAGDDFEAPLRSLLALPYEFRRHWDENPTSRLGETRRRLDADLERAAAAAAAMF